MFNQQTRDAIVRAADFFAANPNKRLRGTLAQNAEGVCVSPTAPNATCWCALGRIAKELDLGHDGFDTEPVYVALTERGIDNSAVYVANDDEETTTDQVVDMLKELASDA